MGLPAAVAGVASKVTTFLSRTGLSAAVSGAVADQVATAATQAALSKVRSTKKAAPKKGKAAKKDVDALAEQWLATANPVEAKSPVTIGGTIAPYKPMGGANFEEEVHADHQPHWDDDDPPPDSMIDTSNGIRRTRENVAVDARRRDNPIIETDVDASGNLVARPLLDDSLPVPLAEFEDDVIKDVNPVTIGLHASVLPGTRIVSLNKPVVTMDSPLNVLLEVLRIGGMAYVTAHMNDKKDVKHMRTVTVDQLVVRSAVSKALNQSEGDTSDAGYDARYRGSQEATHGGVTGSVRPLVAPPIDGDWSPMVESPKDTVIDRPSVTIELPERS